jgi:hypothetical protein
VILSLDCATKTGWALIEKGMVYESGMQDFSKKRGESNGIMFIKFRRWLAGMLYDNKADFVIYEQSGVFRSGAASEIALNLTGRVQEICEQHFI